MSTNFLQLHLSFPLLSTSHIWNFIFYGGSGSCLLKSIFIGLLANPWCQKKYYIILWEYIKCVLLPLTEVMGLTIILISGIHNFCERREYAFNVLSEYSIITHVRIVILTHTLTSNWEFRKRTSVVHMLRRLVALMFSVIHGSAVCYDRSVV